MKKNSGILKLIMLLLLFPLVVWQLSFKKTHQLYKENKELSEQMISIDKNRTQEAHPLVLSTSPFISNGKLLEKVDTLLKEFQVEMISFQPALISEDGNSKLYSGNLVLRGTYINLVKFINAIERKELPVKLSSAVFSYTPAKGKGIRKIELALLFQQIES